MDKNQITLVAAWIAAGASLLSLFANLIFKRQAELRLAHRKVLEKDIADISEAIHSTIATSRMLCKARTPESQDNWRGKADQATETLKSVRVRHRYDLWGITDQINLLSRLPDWIEHSRNKPIFTEPLFSLGRLLGTRLDRAVRYSYTSGRSPTYAQRLLDLSAAWQLKVKYAKMKAHKRDFEGGK